jgi:glycerophosphoryl diester phosphodiesterase
MAERGFNPGLPLPLVVAHRGASADEPENTFPAFEAAIEAGADAVELDVRMSRDGQAVVIHDASVDRTTGGRGLVRDQSVRELKTYRMRSSSGERAEIPTLVEALTVLSGRVAVDVEIKNLPGEPDHEPDRERAVEATLRELDVSGFVGAVLISSFNPRSISRARDLDGRVPTGLLVLDAMPTADALALVREGGHQWVLPSAPAVLRSGRSLVSRAHAGGVRLGTWIVDDPGIAADLASWGVDAVATNDPRTIVPAVRGARWGG